MVKWLYAPSSWLGENRIFAEEKWVALDGDMHKVAIIDETQDRGGWLDVSPLNTGRRVHTEHFTRCWRCGPSSRALQRDMGHLFGGCHHVSARLRDIIEAREPDVHQFIPMTIHYRGKVMPQRYAMIVCNRTDALVDDACIPPIRADKRTYLRWVDDDLCRPLPDWRVAYDAAKLKGVHLFTDARIRALAVSDVLAADIEAAGLVGVEVSDARTITLDG